MRRRDGRGCGRSWAVALSPDFRPPPVRGLLQQGPALDALLDMVPLPRLAVAACATLAAEDSHARQLGSRQPSQAELRPLLLMLPGLISSMQDRFWTVSYDGAIAWVRTCEAIRRQPSVEGLAPLFVAVCRLLE